MQGVRRPSTAAFAASLAFALPTSGCAVAPTPPVPFVRSDAALRSLSATGAGKIRHVVYVIQENRSFNDLFKGYPGAYTVSSGKDSLGNRIRLSPVSLTTIYVINHGAGAMFAACDGTGSLPGMDCRMDGFDKEGAGGNLPHPEFVYVPRSETKPYWDMAHEWVVADKMFTSQLDDSFVAHQYAVAAQAQSSVDVPDGEWGCEGGKSDQETTISLQRVIGNPQRPCFDYKTLGDEFDKAGLEWRFYTSKFNVPYSGLWSGYQAVHHIYKGPDWKKDVITPQKRFLTDVAAGKLASFTWVTPLCPDSDHLDCGGGYGPSWVASIVNAVGKSKFWDSTAIFVQWDDWGGVYDPVPPPFKDYDGLGFRVPLIVISPYAKQNYVSHVQYESASVLRFAEDLFGLNQLSAADARAKSPAADCFDFSKKPREFVPIQAPQDEQFFLNQPNDGRIPDEE
ncbi:MAG: alkaline phosphatase family protein [Candidatus Baltobacteraceae bacterium]